MWCGRVDIRRFTRRFTTGGTEGHGGNTGGNKEAMAKDEWEAGSEEPGAGARPGASRWVMFGMLGLVAMGLVAVLAFQFDPGPPPKAIEDDPLLVQGRRVYLVNCAGCHGDTGKGDGPKAKGLTGPPPGDLTAAH